LTLIRSNNCLGLKQPNTQTLMLLMETVACQTQNPIASEGLAEGHSENLLEATSYTGGLS
jgi:hypothetical protein